VGWDNLVYGVLLVVFIIFLPKGILGSVLDRWKTQFGKPKGLMSKKAL
jgi:branched-chain amino acid transport system permease protein